MDWPSAPDETAGAPSGSGHALHGKAEPGPPVVSSQCKIAAAHSAQMDATMAAARADYDAKVAELKADLEATRGEKERMDTELVYLRASSRTERLEWNKERKLLSRKIAEADARARDAADGIATADEFVALQKSLANKEATIRNLRKALDAKDAQHAKLKLEAACGSTVQNDVDTLMVRVATLEQALGQEREARKAAEQAAEARSAETRGLERRLAAALESATRAEQTAATSVKEVSKITNEVRDARAAQRHAELWLEKSLAEVDAVHAVLAHERSVAGAGARNTPIPQAPQTPTPVDHAMQTPQPNLHRHPPSPAYYGGSGCGSGRRTEGREAAVGPTAQTPTPDSPASILASLGGNTGGSGGRGSRVVSARGAAASSAAASTLPAFPVSPTSPIRRSPAVESGLQTPDLDATRPELFSTTRLRSRVGGRGRGMGMAGEDGDIITDDDGAGDGTLAATALRGEGGRRGDDLFSPPTPTILFGSLAGDGGSTMWGSENNAAAAGAPGAPAAARWLSEGGSGGGEGDARHDAEEYAAAKVMTNRTATTPTKHAVGGRGGGSSKAREDVAASLLSMLRLETSKRKQAEARAAELEAAAAATAAAAPAPAAAAAPSSAAAFSSQQQACGSHGVRSEVCPCIRGVQSHGGGTSRSPDLSADYARMDQDWQATKVLALVREARNKLGSTGGGREAVKASRAAGSGGGYQPDASSPCGDTSPSSEVASLIQQFDEMLTRSADENVQLRVFCSHLEGLLAAHSDATANGNTSSVGPGRVAGAGARAGGGCSCGRTSAWLAGGSSGYRPEPPFPRMATLGERRQGSPV